MQQPPLEYRAPGTAGPAVHWVRRPLYWLLFIVPSLPLVVLLIPRGFTLMSEPTDPWYAPYTTLFALFAAFYVYPATAVSMAMGVEPTSPGWIAMVLLYTSLIGWCACSLVARGRSRAKDLR